MNERREGSENIYSQDYSNVESSDREFVIPHEAEGPNIHTLRVDETGFEMPVSFHVKAASFYTTGLSKEDNTGGIISGNIRDGLVKISHIDLAKSLRGKGVGKALLVDLERQIQQQGSKPFFLLSQIPRQ